MLSGKDFLELLASCLWTRGVVNLETIDFKDQSALEGDALSRLLHTTGIPALRILTLRGAVDKKLKITGEIPVPIKDCTALVSLDLQYADHTGVSRALSLVIYTPDLALAIVLTKVKSQAFSPI